MPNHILEYRLSTTENVNVVQVTNNLKTVVDWPLIPQGAKMKIPNPYYASARHTQSDPRK